MNAWSILVPYNQSRRIASFSRQNVLKPTISIPLWETFSLQVSGEIPHLPHPLHPPPPHLQPSLPKTPFVLKTINSPQKTRRPQRRFYLSNLIDGTKMFRFRLQAWGEVENIIFQSSNL